MLLQSHKLIILLVLSCYITFTCGKQPHIWFIVADDFGWNDVGFHNPDMITPNIDKLASTGIILDQAYVQPVCTPSRNSFMSGVYAFKAGLQHGAILPQQAVCAPLNLTYLPQRLRELGYSTHMVGKWHLGFCKWECTPTYRGFDTFYGFYQGQEDYFNKTIQGGFDYRLNKEVFKGDMEYSAMSHAKRMKEIISTRNETKPLFLYSAFQSTHIPIEVPKRFEDMYPNIKTEGRRQFSGMVTAMDESIGNITNALKEAGIYEDTLIIFTADNGGWTQFYGNNYPLRGGKLTIYEGGTRAVSFLHGAGLEKSGVVYDGLIHAVDWHSTVHAAAGGTPDKTIDGMNLWEEIRTLSPSKREEFIYNLDNHAPELQGAAAIRVGDYKYIEGFPGIYPGWYKPDDVTEDLGLTGTDQDLRTIEQMLRPNFTKPTAVLQELFHIKDDPEERHNLAREHPDIVKKLSERMAEYRKQMVPALFPQNDPKSNPTNFDGVWSPGWC